jgi:sugar lactone lactonase YvrE
MMRLNMRAGVMALAVISASVFFSGQAVAADSGMMGAAGGRQFVSLAIANPRGVAVDSAGNLYVADVDAQKVYKITPGNEVSTVAGAASVSAPLALSVGPDGTLVVTDLDNAAVIQITPAGKVTSVDKGAGPAALASPAGAVLDHVGNVFVANNSNNVILKITADGKASIFAGTVGATGSADGTGSAARFAMPRGIAIDGKDNLYVTDEGNSNIRKITSEGVVTTLAGTAGKAGTADGKGLAAQFGAPRSLTASADGTVYVADTDNQLIRKITPDGVVTTLAGKSGDSGKVDGKGSAAQFSNPRGIAVDGAGNVFVADSENGAVREISPDGTVTTVVGTK